MKALVFGVPPEPFEVPDDANLLTKDLTRSRAGLRGMPDPVPLHDDWVTTPPRLTGTCGSDSKQIRLDQWRDAFLAIANRACSGATKVAIDQRSQPWHP